MTIKSNIKNARSISCGVSIGKGNAPEEYKGRKTEYFERRTKDFIKDKAKYATDYFEALAQGLDLSEPEKWQKVTMRMADYVSTSYIVKPTPSSTRAFDDNKLIMIDNPKIDYIPLGAKFITMGSTWLVTTPNNISEGDGKAIVSRANTTWNHLDFYGNLLREPIVVQNIYPQANDPTNQQPVVNNRGYFTIFCQANKYTKELGNNSRIILGKSAYMITGFSDFIQEFTDDDNSVRAYTFTARAIEPNKEIDDIEKRVADGKTFNWEITINGDKEIGKGSTKQLTATSKRKGEEITATDEYPIHYEWSTSDNDIVSINEQTGEITGVAIGQATITCYLSENTEIRKETEITVKAAENEQGIGFISDVPEQIFSYQIATIKAKNYRDENEPVTWQFTNADRGAYTVEINGNEAEIKVWLPSKKPLKITISNGIDKLTKEIKLASI